MIILCPSCKAFTLKIIEKKQIERKVLNSNVYDEKLEMHLISVSTEVYTHIATCSCGFIGVVSECNKVGLLSKNKV